MNILQSKEDCSTNDSKYAFTMESEKLMHLPLDGSMHVVFTGHYNGVGVEVRSPDEMTLLHHMGCFGKGTASRSKPKAMENQNSPTIMRKRQFLKRNYWYKKFGKCKQTATNSDSFFKDIDQFISKIVHDSKNQGGKEVIDLVSSEDDNSEENYDNSEVIKYQNEFDMSEKQDIVVIVPNSDSEDDNYFANLKPKCCVDKIILQKKLILIPEEAFFLLYGLGCLQILDCDDRILNIDECWKIFCDNECHFIEKYIVYHYFRSKGYVVKPGIKFGGDYLLYKDGPEVNHADYIVVINFGEDKFNWISVLGHVRMATTTVKEIMFAEVIRPSKENMQLPQDLCQFTVRELVLTRKLPVIINNDID